jgi:hypothetical protein
MKLPYSNENVLAVLTAMGNTVDEVVATLERYRVRGTHTTATCPIAVYLRSKIDHPTLIVTSKMVVRDSHELTTLILEGSSVAHAIMLPAPVSVFIHRFDRKDDYSQLFGYPHVLLDPTPENITMLLGELGVKADDVAQALRDQGCRGRRGRGKCPIHVYLETRLVDIGDLEVLTNSYVLNSKWHTMPYNVSSFIQLFDNEQYRDLDINYPPSVEERDDLAIIHQPD